MASFKKVLFSLFIILNIILSVSVVYAEDYIHRQKISFASVAVNKNTADLANVPMDSGYVLWYTVVSAASIDYDIYFFVADDAAWTADADAYKNSIYQVYTRQTITSAYFADDTVIPFKCVDGSKKLYIGIFNDDDANASTFSVTLYMLERPGKVLPDLSK